MMQNSYLVLARKYRPQNFDELIGQEVLVTTLSNAIKNNRLHHAYILTGIRGVGKTTTARIIAKTLNCLNRDLNSQIKACGVCANCLAISASKHQDVIEIDAASRTGVDDIREIIDSIAYAPVMATYKIYIIDEVHMLSNSAFNALLKTLEEPPAHVKFIFATTEIKKVPITILSRCQRFDLRRLDENEIVQHLKNILVKENINADEQALEVIAKISEGSVRDSLSLLDQALSSNNYQQFLSGDVVEKMLGLNDKSKIIELFTAILQGDFTAAFAKFSQFYSYSSDILQLLTDLMDIVSKTTCSKLVTNYKAEGYSKFQQEKISEIAKKVSLNALTRIWQMLLKGNSEITYETSPKMAFEMLLVRICHLAALPNLSEILLDLNQSQDSLPNSTEKIAPNINADNSFKTKENKPAAEVEDEIVNEILRNFAGAKII
ncbi:MAG: DNA polymerase III subunit gamma/tau [Rickettsiales bacterium]|nr:DNA polymerase III subunit gamma/tau [Rickettsiales bacterium]